MTLFHFMHNDLRSGYYGTCSGLYILYWSSPGYSPYWEVKFRTPETLNCLFQIMSQMPRTVECHAWLGLSLLAASSPVLSSSFSALCLGLKDAHRAAAYRMHGKNLNLWLGGFSHVEPRFLVTQDEAPRREMVGAGCMHINRTTEI